MTEQPTSNDYLDLIRVPLDQAIERLDRQIKAIEAKHARTGIGGNMITEVLDTAKKHFSDNVVETLTKMKKVEAATELRPEALLQLTSPTLEDFLNRTKALIELIKRHIQPSDGIVKMIDETKLGLDRELQLKARQARVGLLNLNEPEDQASFRVERGPDGEAAFRVYRGEITGLRDHAEQAERLTRALSRAVSEEIKRLRAERRNDPEADQTIDFLTLIASTLDKIADTIREAKNLPTGEARDKTFAQAETLLESLARAGKDYATKNYERVLNFGGNTVFVLLGTAMFTQMLGVSPDLAFAGQLALLNMNLPGEK